MKNNHFFQCYCWSAAAPSFLDSLTVSLSTFTCELVLLLSLTFSPAISPLFSSYPFSSWGGISYSHSVISISMSNCSSSSSLSNLLNSSLNPSMLLISLFLQINFFYTDVSTLVIEVFPMLSYLLTCLSAERQYLLSLCSPISALFSSWICIWPSPSNPSSSDSVSVF